MKLRDDMTDLGLEMHSLLRTLFPICRSITGNGVRQTLKIIKEIIPITIHEVSSGTKVLDWEIPNEWNIKDAYVQNEHGDKIISFKENNINKMVTTVTDGLSFKANSIVISANSNKPPVTTPRLVSKSRSSGP